MDRPATRQIGRAEVPRSTRDRNAISDLQTRAAKLREQGFAGAVRGLVAAGG